MKQISSRTPISSLADSDKFLKKGYREDKEDKDPRKLTINQNSENLLTHSSKRQKERKNFQKRNTTKIRDPDTGVLFECDVQNPPKSYTFIKSNT